MDFIFIQQIKQGFFLPFSIIMSNNGKGRLKGIAFRAADQPVGLALLNSYGNPLHIAGHMRADVWQSRRGVQIVIEDAAKTHGG